MRTRQPFTPAEFDAACRELIRQCPFMSETSGYRSLARNASVNGAAGSKHLLGMARDYAAPSAAGLDMAMAAARELGLWVDVHDKGSGNHLHVQGLAPGDVPEWWLAKYGDAATRAKA